MVGWCFLLCSLTGGGIDGKLAEGMYQCSRAIPKRVAAARAAVSMRRIRRPRDKSFAPASVADWNSKSVRPPSGPMAMMCVWGTSGMEAAPAVFP